MLTAVELKDQASKILSDYKAEDLVTIDLHNLTDVAEYMIVATATSTTHARALLQHLCRELTTFKVKPLHLEGENTNEWLLADFGDLIVHIMLAPIRSYYELEKLWQIKPHSVEE